MFGLDTTTLAFIALVAFSGAALVYAFLFQKIEQENRTDKRLKTIQAASTDRSALNAARDRTNDANRRRKAVQDNLKDLEERQKNRDKITKSPPSRCCIICHLFSNGIAACRPRSTALSAAAPRG